MIMISKKTLQKIYNTVDHTPFEIASLGIHYTKERTSFSVFAPTTEALFLILDNTVRYPMEKKEGTFTLTLEGDYETHLCHYERNDGVSFTDPFSYADSIDGKDSYILDEEKFPRERFLSAPVSDPVIYECSVRDFSSSLPCAHQKKFLGLIEEGITVDGEKAGFDYLKDLGITHVQLMPVFDFDDDRKHGSEYNWGYNPVAYLSLKKSYISDLEDPYASVYELRRAVDRFHQNGLRIVLDVVYNHVYKVKENTLDRMIPYYFFRYKDDMKPANGTWCGNEVRTEGKFARAYFKEIVRRIVTTYDIDGIRYDLMGIMDIDTVKELFITARMIKRDFLMYGEGWNMGDVLDEEMRASEINLDKIYPVGTFNRFFRDGITSFILEEKGSRIAVPDILSESKEEGFTKEQSINYVECHDNRTFYDKMAYYGGDLKLRKKYCRMGIALTAFARGVPFFHSGQEFLRTKKGIDNSYNLPDSINTLDWKRKNEYRDITEYFRKCLKVRKANPEFTMKEVRILFREYYELVICEYGDLCLLINPCVFDHVFEDGNTYDVLFDQNGEAPGVKKAFDVPAHSLVLARRI